MKKSFTLIELLISVLILSVLFFALSSFISSLKLSQNSIQKKFDSLKSDTLRVLYYDIINANNVTIENRGDFVRVFMQTSNSFYNIAKPYVFWYVSKNKNTLIRYESPKPFGLEKEFYLDKFIQNVKIFKIYKNRGRYFIFLKAKKPIYFEFYKGF